MIKISSGQSEKTSKCASVTGDSGGCSPKHALKFRENTNSEM